ncbi:MAG: glycosyltransferase family 9 protein [Bacteroidales bacterium]
MAKRHIIVIRFSAIGDVAIASILLKAYALANPDVDFTMCSTDFLEPLFTDVKNINFYPANFSKDHNNLKYVLKFAKELYKLHPTDIADIHDVIRTKIIRNYMQFKHVNCKHLHKDRKLRKILTKGTDYKPIIPPSLRNYEKVFLKLGLKNPEIKDTPYIKKDYSKLEPNHIFKIGISPFAAHTGKVWPIDRMEEVIKNLPEDKYKIYLFGGRNDKPMLEKWEKKFSNVESLAGKFDLGKELDYISKLDLMISMDSGNMHLASCVNTPVVSIWGSTHPNAGFYGWRQDPENIIQTNLICRPCSCYGKKECKRGDFKCMTSITPDIVLKKIHKVLGN